MIIFITFSCPTSSGPPQIVGGPQNQFVVNDGSSAMFVCTVIADPLHETEWSFTDVNGVTVERIAATGSMTTSSKYSINRDRTEEMLFGQLTVRNVQFSDRGTYTCLAENFNGEESAQANLTVHGECLSQLFSSLWDISSLL